MPVQPRDTRALIRRAEWGVLRQGTLFAGATADNYEGCMVHGLIITAHCDLAQAKVPVINFVPVVRLRDWLCRDFANILLRRSRPQAIGRLKNQLKSAKQSPSILETQSVATVVSAFFDLDATKESVRKLAEQANESRRQIELCDSLQGKPILSSEELLELKSIGEPSYQAILQDCLQQKLTGYYFLATLDPNESHSGYIALLRQIYHMPFKLAEVIASGCDAQSIEQLFRDDPASYARLDVSEHTFLMPVGQLVSPYLEHLMQAFALLYSRIGVPDLDNSYTSSLIAATPEDL